MMMTETGNPAGEQSVRLPENLRRYYLESMGVQCWVLHHAENPLQEGVLTEAQPVEKMPLEKPCPKILLPEEKGASAQNQVQSAPDFSRIEQAITDCFKCDFATEHTRKTAGKGDASALMVVTLSSVMTEAEEQLLIKMFQAIGLETDDIYLTSLLKCQLPDDVLATPSQIKSCSVFLKQQISLIQPDYLFVMGEQASQYLLQQDAALDDLRSHQHEYAKIPVVVSYAPADLLLSPADKKKAWADLQSLQKMMQI